MKNLVRAAITAATLTSTSGTALADTVSVPERLMGDLQADLNLADFQAAGITGNLGRETGNFQFMRELSPIVAGSRGGIGYAQWTGPRHDAFLAFAGDADPMTYEVNYAFLIEELEGPYARVLDRVRETETLEEATEVFMRGYLAPHPKYLHLDERISLASDYLVGDFNGAGCASDHRMYEAGALEVLQECPGSLAGLRPRARPESWAATDLASAEEVRPRARPTPTGTITQASAEQVTLLSETLRVRDPFKTADPSPADPS